MWLAMCALDATPDATANIPDCAVGLRSSETIYEQLTVEISQVQFVNRTADEMLEKKIENKSLM